MRDNRKIAGSIQTLGDASDTSTAQFPTKAADLVAKFNEFINARRGWKTADQARKAFLAAAKACGMLPRVKSRYFFDRLPII